MTEAEEVISNWKAGSTIELWRLSDDVLKKVERLVRDDGSREGREIRKNAEYAWYEKYGGGEDTYNCGGY